MGDRGAKNDPATADDIAEMAVVVREAIEAGALGFSTSRVLSHPAILGEPDLPADPTQLFDSLATSLQHMGDLLYLLGDEPDYEPTPDRTVTALGGSDPLAYMYDVMLERGGQSFFLAPFFNYAHGNHD